ncbi:MAG: 1,4-alpha-glucan-branching enzyme, partial [Luteolibacter sp.]
MPKRPQIVIDDPWLESHEEAIVGRLQRFEDESASIRAQHVNLHSYANSHLQLGLHFDVGASLWVVREWAPAARSVSLIGDFNEWDGSTHPLKLSAGGIWELELPAHSLKHEQG